MVIGEVGLIMDISNLFIIAKHSFNFNLNLNGMWYGNFLSWPTQPPILKITLNDLEGEART